MAKQATTKKLTKAQPQTVDSLEAKKYETTPFKTAVKLSKGYKYDSPISKLITFEGSKNEKVLKMNHRRALKNDGEAQSFTAVINDALDLLLFMRGLLKVEEVSAEALIILKNYKPNKLNKTKQK